jgi:putative phage-type endonuclease
MLTQEQLQARRRGIGASEVASVLGLTPWRTPFQVWLEKTGRLEPNELEKLSRPYWGHKLEDDAAEGYEDATGLKLRRVNKTLYHPKHAWMFCHLDRKIVGQKKIVECKAPDAASSFQWGKSGTDQVPDIYFIQVQHQMGVTGWEEADLAVLIGGNDFRFYTIKRDESIIDYIIKKGCEFQNYVETDMPPQFQTRDDVELCYKKDTGHYIDATPDILEKVVQFKEVKSAMKELEVMAKELEYSITHYLKDASGLICQGKTLITWRADKNGKRSLRLKGEKNEHSSTTSI